MHSIDFVEFDDHIHMLSWDDSEPERIVSDGICEMSGVTLGPQMPIPFKLVPEAASMSMGFRLHMLMMFTLLMYSMLSAMVEWYDSSPPQPLDSWRGCPPRGASSSTHRDALIRVLSQNRVETTTTPEGLIHMVMAGKATCIAVKSHLSSGQGLGLNVCPLVTVIALGYAPSDFGPSIQTVRAYDNTQREVMGTLKIELLISPATFVTLFQVLRIPASSNLLWANLGSTKPGPFLLPFMRSHSDDDLLLTGFTFDEVQTLEMEDFCQDFVAMSFDQHSTTVVLDMMRGMSYLPGMGLGRRQHGPREFMTFPDHNVLFELGFIPTEVDYRYMARLHKERVRARLTHTPFDYPIRPYTLSLTGYFMRASEPQAPSDGIIGGLSTTQEAELQYLVQQLRLSDGAPSTSTSTLTALHLQIT
ncbi:hypothetical protein CK203_064809 [Vitis vinifera]|uniref:Uncharacterized protein n=1 Tax=Vitis vinifera TaxID=29760 RepID=A0A438FY48_VITVI|nr:hypothetical protein CK203_064809 [Vitis vinifera]